MKRLLKTGFEELDGLLGGGVERGTVTVLGALPYLGKTEFLMNIANRLLPDHSCLFRLWRIDEFDMIDMECCLIGDFDRVEINQKEIKNRVDVILDDYLEKEKLSFCIDQFSIWSIIIKVIQQKAEHGLDAVFLGALPPMSVQQQKQTLIALKELAEHLDIVIFVEVHILKRNDKTRSMKDLPAIFTEYADNVLFLDRPDCHATAEEILTGRVVRNKANVFVAKSKNGGIGVVEFYYDFMKYRFMPWGDFEEKMQLIYETQSD